MRPRSSHKNQRRLKKHFKMLEITVIVENKNKSGSQCN